MLSMKLSIVNTALGAVFKDTMTIIIMTLLITALRITLINAILPICFFILLLQVKLFISKISYV
jgi:hypothetical protein